MDFPLSENVVFQLVCRDLCKLERCSTHRIPYIIPYFWVKDPNPPAICHEQPEGSGSSINLPLASSDYGFSNDWIGGGIGVLPEMFFKTYLHLICGEDQLRWTFGMAMEGGRERETSPNLAINVINASIRHVYTEGWLLVLHHQWALHWGRPHETRGFRLRSPGEGLHFAARFPGFIIGI